MLNKTQTSTLVNFRVMALLRQLAFIFVVVAAALWSPLFGGERAIVAVASVSATIAALFISFKNVTMNFDSSH